MTTLVGLHLPGKGCWLAADGRCLSGLRPGISGPKIVKWSQRIGGKTYTNAMAFSGSLRLGQIVIAAIKAKDKRITAARSHTDAMQGVAAALTDAGVPAVDSGDGIPGYSLEGVLWHGGNLYEYGSCLSPSQPEPVCGAILAVAGSGSPVAYGALATRLRLCDGKLAKADVDAVIRDAAEVTADFDVGTGKQWTICAL